ncbi:hypothetical protein BB561_001880 [Smittium simulii]|uniref:Uncharacterized protein n=1 Tax=Smittium simulii TaxID=133385 RepID=A0A2T9YSL5_9FUNG|nr:hypothetical protein BB561_001880 [Smittium simulii]
MPIKNGMIISSELNSVQFSWLLATNVIAIICSLLVILILIIFWKNILLLYTVTKPALYNPAVVSSELDLWNTYNSNYSSRLRWIFLLLFFNPGNMKKQNPVILSFYFITSIVDFFNSIFRTLYYLGFSLTRIHFFNSSVFLADLYTILLNFLSLFSVLLRLLPLLQLVLIIVFKTNRIVYYLRFTTIFFAAVALTSTLFSRYISIILNGSSSNIQCSNYCGYFYNLFFSNIQPASNFYPEPKHLKEIKLKLKRLTNIRKADPIMIINQESSSKAQISFFPIIRRALAFPVLTTLSYILLYKWVHMTINQIIDINPSIPTAIPSSFFYNTKSIIQSQSFAVHYLDSYDIIPSNLYFLANLALCIPAIHLFSSLLLEKPFKDSIINYLRQKFYRIFFNNSSNNESNSKDYHNAENTTLNAASGKLNQPDILSRSALNSSSRTFIQSISIIDAQPSFESYSIGPLKNHKSATLGYT